MPMLGCNALKIVDIYLTIFTTEDRISFSFLNRAKNDFINLSVLADCEFLRNTALNFLNKDYKDHV